MTTHHATATPTAWAHLPNAPHIDRILAHLRAHLRAHPQTWAAAWTAAYDAIRGAAWTAAYDAARDASYYAARAAAWDAAWDAARGAARGAAWDAAYDVARTAASDAARGAILALIAWDDAGLLLDMPADAVRLLAASGHQPAVLMLPACIALSSTT